MILSCPSCGARFRLDPDKLGVAGRNVRCSKCRHTWHVAPHAPEEPQPAENRPHEPAEDPLPRALREDTAPPGTATAKPDDTSYATPRRSRPSPPPERYELARRRTIPIGWLVLLLVTGGLMAGLWFGREHIVTQVPAAARLYEMAGIPVNVVAPDLEMRDVTRKRRIVDGRNLLVVEGRIVNTADATREVPLLRVALYDAAGKELTAWTFAPEIDSLPPGGEARFATTRADPPSAARELSLTFARRGS